MGKITINKDTYDNLANIVKIAGLTPEQVLKNLELSPQVSNNKVHLTYTGKGIRRKERFEERDRARRLLPINSNLVGNNHVSTKYENPIHKLENQLDPLPIRDGDKEEREAYQKQESDIYNYINNYNQKFDIQNSLSFHPVDEKSNHLYPLRNEKGEVVGVRPFDPAQDWTSASPKETPLSGVDPFAKFYVEMVALGKPLQWLGRGVQWGLAKTGNQWARNQIAGRAFNNAANESFGLYGQKPLTGYVAETRVPTQENLYAASIVDDANYFDNFVSLNSDLPKPTNGNSLIAVRNSVKASQKASSDIAKMNMYHDENVAEYNRATGSNVKSVPFRENTLGLQTKILPDDEFNATMSKKRTNSPNDDVRNIGGLYSSEDNMIYLRQKGSPSGAYHEHLHAHKYGVTNPEVTNWRISQLIDEDTYNSIPPRLRKYYLSDVEFPVHLRQQGENMGIEVGQEFPGEKAFDEIFENANTSGTSGAAYYAAESLRNNYSLERKKLFWKALNGTLFGGAAIGTGVSILDNNKVKYYQYGGQLSRIFQSRRFQKNLSKIFKKTKGIINRQIERRNFENGGWRDALQETWWEEPETEEEEFEMEEPEEEESNISINGIPKSRFNRFNNSFQYNDYFNHPKTNFY